MDVETGLFWQRLVVKDTIKAGLVVAGKKDIVVSQLWVDGVHTPVEHDGRAGELLVHHSLGQTWVGQQLVVHIGEISVGDDDVVEHLNETVSTLRLEIARLKKKKK